MKKKKFSPYTPMNEADSPTLGRYALLAQVAAANQGGPYVPVGLSYPAQDPVPEDPKDFGAWMDRNVKNLDEEDPIRVDVNTSKYFYEKEAPPNRNGHIGEWTRDAQGRLVAPKITY